MTPPTLRTERLVFRALRAEDRSLLCGMFEDENFRRHLGPDKPAGERWIRALGGRGMWPIHGYGFWAVDDENGFAGHVGIGDFCRDFELPGLELGWMFAPRTWSRGYATEAMREILKWADNQGHALTCALIAPENMASIRVAEKIGMHRTGTADLDGPVDVYERGRDRG